MIHTINITTKTRKGDAYSQVAINPFPIIYINDGTPDDILNEAELIESIRKYIKNSTTYNNAILNIKSLTDDLSEVETNSFVLKDRVSLEEWT